MAKRKRKPWISPNISFWINGLIAGIVIGAIALQIVLFLQDRQVVSDRHQGTSVESDQ